MKTPREILLRRHRSAADKLDAVREEVLAAAGHRPSVRQPLLVSTALKLWRDLVFPCRRIWAGFAIVWMAILAFNVSMRPLSRPTLARNGPPPSPEMVRAFLEREGLLVELIKPRETGVAGPPKPALPQPRSQRRGETVPT